MDLSDISDIQDVMSTTSDEDIPDLEHFQTVNMDYGLHRNMYSLTPSPN